MGTSRSQRKDLQKGEGLRESFNDFLEYVLTQAKKIIDNGKVSSLTLAELERLAREGKKGAGEPIRPLKPDQMERWVRDSLAALEKGVSPSERAIVCAMKLYNIFEKAQTPKDLGDGLNGWVVG